MTAEIIEGTAVELVPEIRAVAVVQQPGQSLVATNDREGPDAMVAVATRLANVLKDIVEQRRLYAVIQGKKYPQVEAWMTIARLDNVVAREARPPVRQDDGAYEAFAELVRLSDGMVIGSASALCGGPDDEPWGGTPAKYGKPALGPRPEHARRSMANTRAISRAFRAHYSWIMALAGYEPTPAEEMPAETSGHSSSSTARSAPVASPGDGGTPLAGSWSGHFRTTKTADGKARMENTRGHVLKFVVTDPEPNPGFRRINVRVYGDLAVALATAIEAFEPDAIVVEGELHEESFTKDGQDITYAVVEATCIHTPDWTLPAAGEPTEPTQSATDTVNDLDNLPW